MSEKIKVGDKLRRLAYGGDIYKVGKLYEVMEITDGGYPVIIDERGGNMWVDVPLDDKLWELSRS